MNTRERTQDLANDIRTKIYGKEVREALATGIEESGNTSQEARDITENLLDGSYDTGLLNTEIEQRMNNLYSTKGVAMDELYTEKDTTLTNLYEIEKAELDNLQADYADRAEILETTYAPRLTSAEQDITTNHQEVTAQLAQTTLEAERKRGLNDLTAEVLGAIGGGENTSFNLLSIPEDDSVEFGKTTFIEQSKNLFNKENVLLNTFFKGASANNIDTLITLNGYFVVKKPIYLKGGRSYIVHPVRQYNLVDIDGNVLVSENINNNHAHVTFETPPEGVYLRFAGIMDNLDITQVEEGTTATEVVPYKVTLPDLDFTDEQLDVILKSMPQTEPQTENKEIYFTRENDIVRIISEDSSNTLITELDLSGSANGGLNLLTTKLNGNEVHRINDDITPIRTVSTVGANHGYTTSVVGDKFPNNMQNGQLYPSVKNLVNTIHKQGNKIIIQESYEILDHESLLAWKDANPTLDYTKNLDVIDSVVKLVTNYTFHGFGKCNVDTTLIFMKDSTVSNTGFLQSRRLNVTSTRYMPNINVVGYDFEAGVDMDTFNESLLIKDENLNNPDEPPVFYIDKSAGLTFTMGYIPEQNASNEKRLQQTRNYWDLRSTGKSYPIALSGISSPVTAGTVFQVSGFRNYNINENDLVTFEVVESGEYWYVYIYSLDEHSLINRVIDVPSGKRIETVTNHGVTLLTDTTGAGGITFSTTERASAIFKIKK